MLNRRSFLTANLAAILEWERLRAATGTPLLTRGIVLVPQDLTLKDWPERAKRAGLTTIGIHHPESPQAIRDWVRTETGQGFLASCERLGLAVEYELHAMKELLPRDLFQKSPEFFRSDEKGDRTPDANCCVRSERALELIAENAVALARELRPTTGRHFFWSDDGRPWCSCAHCKGLSPSEQALMVENRILRALRGIDPKASLAHLAYANTLTPPKQVRPDSGVFLEYAPIRRRYDMPYEKQVGPDHLDAFSALEANLGAFPTDTAQVLEYWLDVSRFSGWKRPAVRLPWRPDVLKADVATYGDRGIRHITSFAVYVDADYQALHGEPDFIAEYGTILAAYSPKT